jgi:hypothetical protein
MGDQAVEDMPANRCVHGVLAFDALGELAISYLHHIPPGWFYGKVVCVRPAGLVTNIPTTMR